MWKLLLQILGTGCLACLWLVLIFWIAMAAAFVDAMIKSETKGGR
jgi:hypothetical protein